MQMIQTPTGVLSLGTVVPALCCDLDGTIRFSLGNDFINGVDDIALYPDVEEKLWEYRNKGWLILGISNQGGVAWGHKTVQQVENELDATLALFKNNPFHIIKQCFHMGEAKVFPYNKRSLMRKPDTGMLALMEVDAFQAGYVIDWDNSLFVGDRPEDELCAQNANIPFQWAKYFFQREP